MTVDINVSNILTHYYKVAHLGSINYTIFTSITENHQQLLELELTIRHENPKILITYYNKCLYYFTFGHNNIQQDLIEQYPSIQLKYSNSISIDQIHSKNSGDEVLFENLSFLKAVKKMILYTLSSQGIVKLFGNYCIISQDEFEYKILYIDPILFPNGDLMISCIEREQPTLFNYSLEKVQELSEYVIYIIPSGIRCHLFDVTEFKKNIVEDNEVDNSKLLNLLRLSTGIELEDPMIWVKLIPNLKHLNNQTSTISKFIHSVENKKYILWPWKLCYLQFGEYQQVNEQPVTSTKTPLSLISDFLDFNITNNLKLLEIDQKQEQVQNIPVNVVPSSVSSESAANTVKDIGSIDITMTTPIGEDLFNLPPSESFFKTENGETIKEDEKEKQEDMELDDLFGDDVSSDEQSVHGETDTKPEEEKLDELLEVSELPPPEKLTEKPFTPDYFDIPKDQMITKLTSPDYNDPGAPPPIIPTPLISSTATFTTTNPPSIGPVEYYTEEQPTQVSTVQSAPPSQIPQQKSIFSPILFNPIIKSNIDTKYGKGGKFYVDRESSIDLDFEKQKRTLRATSVSGYTMEKKRRPSLDKPDVSVSSSSEESDEDEEIEDVNNSPPLKLNTEEVQQFYQPSATTNGRYNSTSMVVEFHEKQGFNPSGVNTTGFSSPFTSSIGKLKPESPLSNHELQPTMFSPMDFETTPRLLPNQIEKESIPEPTTTTSPSKILGESSNYLPLILRSINVSTIPNSYLMNNLTTNKFMPNFSINDDDIDNDLEITKSNEMIIKLDNIDQFLCFLSPNLVYDLGFSGFENRLEGKKLSQFKYKLPNEQFQHQFNSIFPYSYKVNLVEFLWDNPQDIPNQLSFLDDITSEEFGDPRSQYKKLNQMEWDSLTINDTNKDTFSNFKQLNYQLYSQVNLDEDSSFKLPVVKTRVLKNDNIVNLNSIGLEYWKYLNFSPVEQPKNFQILLISENLNQCDDEFLNLLANNYNECNFGNISRVNLSTVETRPDLESISNGLLTVNKQDMSYNDFYIQVNRKLIALVELIKLDLINKTNNFEFDQPLLLLFINFNDSLNSQLQICKIFRNFKVALAHHQLPLVQIFTKILPGSLLIKRMQEETYLKIFSNYKLTKISMNLYNQCPNNLIHETTPNTIYTSIVKEPPTKIQFKFMSSGFKDNNFNEDIFLHVAYERSIDKNWFSAAWTDPFGTVTHTKSWYCSRTQPNGRYRGTVLDIIGITDDIWNISSDFFKFLNDVMNNKVTTVGGKKFLVLTRINSVIPDDELVQWKRLSVKNKDISLIVLSVSQTPKLLFSSHIPFETLPEQIPSLSEKESMFRPFSSSPSTSTSAAVATSPNGLNFHSPQQFLNAANFLSPQDTTNTTGTQDTILHDPESDIIGIVPKVALPSFNSPTRLGMKIGYLLRQWNDTQHMSFEVNLLSCSNYWDLNVLMKLILNQYKKLIIMNDILGMRLIDGKLKQEKEGVEGYKVNGLIPWHIAAVGKSLDYLVHIYVEE